MTQTIDELKRQLGGTNAALARARQHEKELQAEVDRLKALNGELCAEVNAATGRARGLFADLKATAPDLARVWERACPELGGGK